jgi:hypothetical protein
LFELGDEGVKYGGGGWIAEKGRVEEIWAFEDYVWVLLFHQGVQAV